VPAPDFKSGERVFKPAETLIKKDRGFSPGGSDPGFLQQPL
jgi:hypothetical protein